MYVGSDQKNKCHKDMGGLLEEGGRDFLVYRLGKPTISHTRPCQCHASASVDEI